MSVRVPRRRPEGPQAPKASKPERPPRPAWQPGKGEGPFQARDYARLRGLPGFSGEAIQVHLELYQGYVDHANAFHRLVEDPRLDGRARAEVRRRFGWEFNGMRLHEHYFDGLTEGGREAGRDGALRPLLERQFGSLDAWRKDFEAAAATRGSGWAVLSWDPVSGRLFDSWTTDHDTGALAGLHPIIVVDAFEHAYLLDYGTDRAGYLKAIFDALDWERAETRLAEATSAQEAGSGRGAQSAAQAMPPAGRGRAARGHPLSGRRT